MFKTASRDLKIFFRKCVTPNTVVVLLMVLLAMFILPFAGALAYRLMHGGKHPAAKHREGFHPRKEIIFFHMNGCGHCIKMMPEWEKFAKSNNSGIPARKVESKEDPALVKKHGIRGFPTVLLIGANGEKQDTYTGPRTADALSAWSSSKA
jgi:thiol-disulfide isomerase/thioredoxin